MRGKKGVKNFNCLSLAVGKKKLDCLLEQFDFMVFIGIQDQHAQVLPGRAFE